MSAVVTPDHKGAALVYLRSRPGVTGIVQASRIAGTLPNGQSMPGFAVSLFKSGGPGRIGTTPLAVYRLDVWCYGPNALEAMNLWRAVHAELMPVQGRPNGFTAAGCRVLDVRAESGPSEITTREGWPVVWSPYLLTISEVPVA